MLKINTNSKKYRIPLTLGALGLSGIFLFQYLTVISEYSYAESISTSAPITLPEIEGEITQKFGTSEQGYKTYMQEIDLKYCQSLPVGTTGQLADGRDGKIYWVTVLGNKGANTHTCWMTQDLDLDLGPSGPELTTVNDGTNLYKGSATTWDGGKSVASTSSGWTQSDGNPTQNINWWERDNGAHKAEHTFLGNLYSYEAATAGTGHTETGSKTEVPGSICPAGWKLPISGNLNGTGSFNSLGMSGSTVTKNPYYYQYGGYITGSLDGVGSYGSYWSATSSHLNYAYSLYFRADGSFNTTGDGSRYAGVSVRCVIRDPNYTAPTMPTPSESDINHPNVSVTVNPVLTLEVTDKEVEITPKTDDIATGEFTAKVSSNAGYDIQLNATENGSTALVNKKDGVTIAEIQASNNVQQGINGWGIKCLESADCVLTNYNALTEYNSPKIYFTRQAGGINVPTKFQVGIGIASDLPSGTYSTNILVTASQK